MLVLDLNVNIFLSFKKFDGVFRDLNLNIFVNEETGTVAIPRNERNAPSQVRACIYTICELLGSFFASETSHATFSETSAASAHSFFSQDIHKKFSLFLIPFKLAFRS